MYQRIRARRGAQVAAVATARKLAGLSGPREQDYAFGQPSLTRHKIRQLELAAAAPSRKVTSMRAPAPQQRRP